LTLTMNRKLRALLGASADSLESIAHPLPGELLDELRVGFKESNGCVVPKNCSPFKIEVNEDETGIECQISKVHFGDFRCNGEPYQSMLEMGIAYAFALKDHLQRSGLGGPFRVILGADAEGDYPSVTVRYHRIRQGQDWLGDDIEGHADGVLAVDFG